MFTKAAEPAQVAKLLDRKNDRKLTPQQELFVLEYMIDLNGTQAAIRAGFDPNTAAQAAAKMMKRGHVKNAISHALAARSRRTGVNADRVIREAAKVAFGDPRVLFREDGALRAPTDYNEDDAAMIEGIKTRRIVEVGKDGEMVPVEIQEVKLVSKLSALTLLAKHLGLLTDKIDVNVTSLATRLDEAFKRTGAGPAIIDVEAEEVEPDTDTDDAPDLSELTPAQAEIAARLLGLQKMIEGPGVVAPAAEPEYDLDAMLGRK